MAGLYDNLICWTGPPGYVGWRKNRFLSSLDVYKYGLRMMGGGGGGGGLKVTVCAPETGNRKFSPETCWKTAERFSRVCCIIFKLAQNRRYFERNGGFIKGILRGVRCTKSLRVLFLHRRPPPGPLLYCTQEQYSSLMNPPKIHENPKCTVQNFDIFAR